MKLLHLIPFTLVLTLGACSEDKSSKLVGKTDLTTTGEPAGTVTARPTTSTPDQDKLLADLGGVKDAVCACPDRACVERTIKAGSAFDDRLNTMYQDEPSIPTAVKTEVDAIQKGVEDCTTRIGGVNPPLSAATTKVLAELDAVSAKICACRDLACAATEQDKGLALEGELDATFKPSGDVPEEAMSRVTAVKTRTEACVEKLSV